MTGKRYPLDCNDPREVRGSYLSYEISRAEIEGCRPERLISDLTIDAENPLVQAGPGRTIFSVSGYDSDARELVEIPEVVRFIRKAEEAKPCWLYFAEPKSMWATIVLMVSCADGTPIRTARGMCAKITARAADSFARRQIDDFLKLCDLAEVDVDECKAAWSAAVAEIFR